MDNVGLACEGGGTKIAYTGGVLKCFLENDIMLPVNVGISAAAQVLEAYISRQPRRIEVTCVDAASLPGLLGWKPLLKEGSLFALEKTSQFIEQTVPLDFKTFFDNPARFEIGVYDLKTKEIVYYPKSYVNVSNDLVIASCSLLLLSKPRSFDGRKVIDAGLRDMIPIGQVLKLGCEKALVISTKEEGYRRKEAPWWQIAAAEVVYHDDAITSDFRNRHLSYKKQWDLIDSLVDQGKCLVLRPQKDMGMTRYTTDAQSLQKWFDLGYEETKERLPEIRRFLGIEEKEED